MNKWKDLIIEIEEFYDYAFGDLLLNIHAKLTWGMASIKLFKIIPLFYSTILIIIRVRYKKRVAMLNEIDIHGLRVHEAKTVLDNFLNKLPRGIHEVCVIHGYRGGTALQTYVRKTYTHKRCVRAMMSLNQGETIFILKDA